MIVKRSMALLSLGTAVGALAFAAPAFAQSAQSQQQMQQQINSLQQQLNTLQAQQGGLYNQAPPMATKGPSFLSTIHFTFAGSFIEGATVWRQRNEISSGASDPPFAQLPFSNSPLYSENEWRASAQQSRLAITATGDIDPTQHLLAHWESDWLGAGVTANSRESNSYNLRIRQAFLEYDNDVWHFHLKAGQQWSLVTQERVGIMQNENTPLTIDAQYVAGFTWARQEGLRIGWDYNKVAWFAVSAEAPELNFPSNSTAAGAVGASPGTAVPPGIAINDLNACNALLDSTTSCANTVAPDFVEKAALDPGWGHYEVFGLQRVIADQVAPTGAVNAWSTKNTFGWGVGGSALVPAVPKYLDLQGAVTYGAGIGRYGASQLPDVVVGPTGALQPITSLQFLVGAVAHPWTGLDLYTYYGQEQTQANFWTVGGVAGGYGNPAYADGGCLNSVAASGPAGFNTPAAGTACQSANVKSTQEFTIGFWQNIYKGPVGRFVFGAEYEYTRLTLFNGAPGAAGTPNAGLSPNNNIFYTSIRYYPF